MVLDSQGGILKVIFFFFTISFLFFKFIQFNFVFN